MRLPFFCLALCLAFAAAAQDSSPDANDFAVEGELLDLGCYAARKARGPEHRDCAARCLGNGNPAGVVDAEGTVYTLAAAAPAFAKYAARTVWILGSADAGLVRPREMYVWEDGGWSPVKLNAFGAPEESE